jgi:hypothetical protein
VFALGCNQHAFCDFFSCRSVPWFALKETIAARFMTKIEISLNPRCRNRGHACGSHSLPITHLSMHQF